MDEARKKMFGATAEYTGGKLVVFPEAQAKQDRAEKQAKIAGSQTLGEYSEKEVMSLIADGMISSEMALEKVERQDASAKKTNLLKRLKGEE